MTAEPRFVGPGFIAINPETPATIEFHECLLAMLRP